VSDAPRPSPEAQKPVPPGQRRWLRWFFVYPVLTVFLLAALAIAGLLWYATTPQFAARMRGVLVHTLQRTTGGRVEMGSFHWSLRHLSIVVDNLTIHGRESADEAPYFYVSQLRLRATLRSYLEPKIVLASLEAVRPEVHLIVYPDGTTNAPQPAAAGNGSTPGVLLALEIGETRVRDGLFLWNDRRIPWELASGPLQIAMRYSRNGPGYKASIDAENLVFRLQKAAQAHSKIHADVELTRHAFSIDNMVVATGPSKLTIRGRLTDFAQPMWQFTANGSVKAREMGAITGVDSFSGGTADLALNASGNSQDEAPAFVIRGHVTMHRGGWNAPWLVLNNVDLTTDVQIDSDTCSFTNVRSFLEDGSRITGNLVLRHCIGPSAPVVTALPAGAQTVHQKSGRRKLLSPRALLDRLHRKHPAIPEHHAVYEPLIGQMDAQVYGVTLPLVLKAVAPRRYWNIGFTTATYGEVTAHWTADGNGLDVHGNLTMRAPPQTLGLVPVTGAAHADYLGDHNQLVIADADEKTPSTTVHASGLLTLHPTDLGSSLKLDATGSNLAEFDQLLTILDLRETPRGQPHALPVELQGPANFHGIIGGSFFALQATGRLTTQQFAVVIAQAPPQGAPAPEPQRIAWDALQAELFWAPWRLKIPQATLIRGQAVIHTALDVSPEKTGRDSYTYNRRARLTASVQTRQAPLKDLPLLHKWLQRPTGWLDADAHVTGVADDLTGAGTVSLSHAVLAGQPVTAAAVHISLHDETIDWKGLHVDGAGGSADGSGSWNFATGAITGDLTGSHFRLNEITALQRPSVDAGGTADFHVHAEGSTSTPIVSAALEVSHLSLGGEPMGQLQAEGHLNGRELRVTMRAGLLQADFNGSGSVLLADNYPGTAHLQFSNFNFEPLLRFTRFSNINGASSLNGAVTVSGPFRKPVSLTGDAHVEAFSATVDGHRVHSGEPMTMQLQNGLLRLSPIQVQGNHVDMTASGTVDLLHENRMRLQGKGSIDAGLIAAFYPLVQSSGALRFTINARGTPQQPDLRGSAEVSHLSIHARNVTNGLTDMNGQLLFDQDRLVIQNLRGSSGGGMLDLHGFVGYRRGIFLDVTANANNVRIRYPKGVSTAADAKLRLQGTSDSALLSGSVKLVRFGVSSSFDVTSLAGGGSGVSGITDPSSPLHRIRLDVNVTSTPELGFQNSFASLTGDVNLRVRGTLADPSVLGRIDISDGEVSFAGSKYKIQQGDIIFSNPVTISPVIDLEALARVQNYDIVISLHGPPNKLDISYRSEPPLTQADVLALLALGRTNEQALMYGEQTQANANLTTEALLGGALNAAVGSRVQKLFGVGSVRVDPNFVGTLGESTARVTVEEQVGPRLTLTFATSINTTAQQLLQAQYDLTRTVSIIAVRDEADVFSMYLQIRGRHK
jgi:translocation and assembly module TamB